MKALIILLVKAYQRLISPLLPQSCKYHPSCSQYAIEAVREYGAARGSVLAAWRLLRCNPLSDGGLDPVENQRLFRSRGRGANGVQKMTGRSDGNRLGEPAPGGAVCGSKHGAGL